MSILLTSPYRGLGEVKIISAIADTKRSVWLLVFEYGDTIAQNWVAGDIRHVEKSIRDIPAVVDGVQEVTPADPKFTDFIAESTPDVTFTNLDADPKYTKLTKTHPIHGALDLWVMLSYDTILTNLYQFALDEGWFAGTIQ